MTIDLVAEVISGVITRLGDMPRSVVPSTVPSMAAIMTAAAIDASPSLRQAQFGDGRLEGPAAV